MSEVSFISQPLALDLYKAVRSYLETPGRKVLDDAIAAPCRQPSIHLL